MKLQFVSGSNVSEYAHGNFHVKNDGTAFDVPDAAAPTFLAAVHPNADGIPAPIFEKAGAVVVETVETAETLGKLKREELVAIAKDLGLDGNDYTNKAELAAAILAAKETN